jgi:hypothetical protein
MTKLNRFKLVPNLPARFKKKIIINYKGGPYYTLRNPLSQAFQKLYESPKLLNLARSGEAQVNLEFMAMVSQNATFLLPLPPFSFSFFFSFCSFFFFFFPLFILLFFLPLLLLLFLLSLIYYNAINHHYTMMTMMKK